MVRFAVIMRLSDDYIIVTRGGVKQQLAHPFSIELFRGWTSFSKGSVFRAIKLFTVVVEVVFG